MYITKIEMFTTKTFMINPDDRTWKAAGKGWIVTGNKRTRPR